MNRILRFVNFLGIAVLSLLCAAQWKTNSRLTGDLNSAQSKIADQSDTIAKQADTIKQDAADLAEYRDRLSTAESQLKTTEVDLRKTKAERDVFAADRKQLLDLRDRFVAALNERDKLLKDQGEAIKQLIATRDEAIKRYNDAMANK